MAEASNLSYHQQVYTAVPAALPNASRAPERITWCPVSGALINKDRIRANCDELQRIAAALQDGTVTAQLLVSKLQALNQQHGAHRPAPQCRRR